MTTQTEALELAIEVFGGGDWHDEIVDTDWADKANNALTVMREALAEQPVVPDAIHHTDTSETLEYITGWNDCRQAMLRSNT